MVKVSSFEHANGATLQTLVQDDRGWLMYMRFSGDPGFSSRNTAYEGPKDACSEYELENGQIDSYPDSWAYPIKTIRKAIEYFESTGERPNFISWHDDSVGSVE